MNVERLIRKYLPMVNIMQLATSVSNQPWLCTLHFFSDEKLNFYWISTKERRHSLEIEKNPKACIYVLVHENTSTENYIIGISLSGEAQLLGEKPGTEIGTNYAKKLNKNLELISDIASGKNPHKFYKFTPKEIVLFDTLNFPNQPRQEWMLK